MTSFVLTAFPISQGFRRQLDARFGGDVEYLSLPTLRRLSPWGLLRTLRARAGRRCIIACEDPASSAVLPILHVVARMAGPSSVVVATADGSVSTLPLRRLAPGAAALAAASAAGAVALRTQQRRLGGLLSAPRHETGRSVSPRRALYLNANLWFGLKAGGSVGHVAGVVNGLARSGVELECFSASEPVLIDEDIEWHRLEPPGAFGLPIEVNYPRFQRHIVETVLAHAHGGFDFVYQRLSVSNFAGVEISRRLGIPLVLEYNGSEVWIARQWGRPLRYERFARDAEDASLCHSDIVVTVSDVLRKELIERGVPAERIACYPNCVDERVYDPERFGDDDRTSLLRSLSIQDDALIATFIGTFGRWHGVDVLARAIAELVDSAAEWLREHRLHFLLVGDGLRMQDVRELLSDPRYAPYVTLTGLVPQAEGPRYLAASDILLSPHVPNSDGSPFFGSPTKLFEYMSMGKAIIASDLDQIGAVLANSIRLSDALRHSPASDETRLAALVSPGRPDELAHMIRFVTEHRNWRDALGANARREALERYTWRHHVAAILDGLAVLPSGDVTP